MLYNNLTFIERLPVRTDDERGVAVVGTVDMHTIFLEANLI